MADETVPAGTQAPAPSTTPSPANAGAVPPAASTTAASTTTPPVDKDKDKDKDTPKAPPVAAAPVAPKPEPKPVVFTGQVKYWYNAARKIRDQGPQVRATVLTLSIHVNEDKLPKDAAAKAALLTKMWLEQVTNVVKRFDGDIHFRLAYSAAECAAKLAATGKAV